MVESNFEILLDSYYEIMYCIYNPSNSKCSWVRLQLCQFICLLLNVFSKALN